jgi:hypothetical protein
METLGIVVLGIIIGVAVQRMIEKRWGDGEHGRREFDWFRTILMSMWFTMPMGIMFSMFVLFKKS